MLILLLQFDDAVLKQSNISDAVSCMIMKMREQGQERQQLDEHIICGMIKSLSVPTMLGLLMIDDDDDAKQGWTNAPNETSLLEYKQRFGFPFILSHGDATAVLASRMASHDSILELDEAVAQLSLIYFRKLQIAIDQRKGDIDDDADDTMVLLTAHVLNVERGIPGAGIHLILQRSTAVNEWLTVATTTTLSTGRASFDNVNPKITSGTYKIVFETGSYFESFGIHCFFPRIETTFTIDRGQAWYHIPCVISPFSSHTLCEKMPLPAPKATTDNHTDESTVITIHVLDVAKGRSAAGVKATLHRQEEEEGDDVWVSVETQVSDPSGRATFGETDTRITPGTYKLVFETGTYFLSNGIIARFPYAQAIFHVQLGQTHYHVPCVVAPFFIQSYKGQYRKG